MYLSQWANEDFNQIEIWKCHMFDFWLIPLDRITYVKGNLSYECERMMGQTGLIAYHLKNKVRL